MEFAMKLLRLIQAHHVAAVVSAVVAPFLMNLSLNQTGDMRIIPVVCVGLFQALITVVIAVVSIRDNGRRDVSLPDKLDIQFLFWICGIAPLMWTSFWMLNALSIIVPPK